MNVTVREHTVDKNTTWGVVKQSLNQHMVFVNDNLAGYVGVTHFLPLCGFPKEMVADVAKQCSELLGKDVQCGDPPPSVNQLLNMLEQNDGVDGDD